MKDRFQARLKAKHPGVNLSKTRLDKISEYAVKKLTADSTDQEIDDLIDDLNEFQPFADLAKNDDRQRLLDAKKVKDDADAKAKADADAKNNPDIKDDEVPSWAKGFMTKIESLEKQLSDGKTKTTQAELVAAAKLKGIPEKYALKHHIGEDFKLDEALAELETEWTEIKQGFTTEGLKTNTFTPGGGNGGGAAGTKVSDAIKKFATDQNKQAVVTKTT